MRNLMLYATVAAAGLFYVAGMFVGSKLTGAKHFLFLTFATVISLPAFVFAAYYLKIFEEPIWLYRWRSLSWSELSASGVGLLMGYLHRKYAYGMNLSKVGKKILFPILLLLVLAIPYLKPIFRPLKDSQFHERWSDDVCLQSTSSTCGPASAVTLLRARGINVTEKELAKEAFTSASGTENWYLNRALTKRGMKIEYRKTTAQPSDLFFPSIAGVRLLDQNGAGHFIAVLDRRGEDYIVGDPLVGKAVMNLQQLKTEYYFTGFFMVLH